MRNLNAKRNGLTLVELAAVLIAMGVLAVSAARNVLNEDAQATKCLSNLQRGMNAVLMYTAEWDGVLPGPVHPMIFRQSNDPAHPGATEREKSMSWLIGPYITPHAPATSDSTIPNVVMDELFRCPTATMISPDNVFNSNSCYVTPKFNYVCNTWGPIASPGSMAHGEANQTDPPHYFGAWYLCDPSPVSSNLSWWPKRLDSIRDTSEEWALGDAWYRKIPGGGSRGPQVKQWFGTFAPQISNYYSVIPSAPFHHTDLRNAKSHFSQNSTTLPEIAFDGETNLAYMDGHVAAFVGTWKKPGEGGTVNPFWSAYSGNHSSSEPWYP